jgi:hypothetical protein
MHSTVRVTEGVERLKGVFLEMPGTQLSIDDASLLSGLEPDVCGLVLEALEDARFLRRTGKGLFVRRTGDFPCWPE